MRSSRVIGGTGSPDGPDTPPNCGDRRQAGATVDAGPVAAMTGTETTEGIRGAGVDVEATADVFAAASSISSIEEVEEDPKFPFCADRPTATA